MGSLNWPLWLVLCSRFHISSEVVKCKVCVSGQTRFRCCHALMMMNVWEREWVCVCLCACVCLSEGQWMGRGVFGGDLLWFLPWRLWLCYTSLSPHIRPSVRDSRSRCSWDPRASSCARWPAAAPVSPGPLAIWMSCHKQTRVHFCCSIKNNNQPWIFHTALQTGCFTCFYWNPAHHSVKVCFSQNRFGSWQMFVSALLQRNGGFWHALIFITL